MLFLLGRKCLRRSLEPVRCCLAGLDPLGFTIQPRIVRREAREATALIAANPDRHTDAAGCRRGHYRVYSAATLLAANTSTCVTTELISEAATPLTAASHFDPGRNCAQANPK